MVGGTTVGVWVGMEVGVTVAVGGTVVCVAVLIAAMLMVGGTAVGLLLVAWQAVNKTAARQNQRSEALAGLLKPVRPIPLKTPGKSTVARCRW
ncbi:MAG: hypothetical protein BroJett015_29490 [Chloroflexota bacterium]|nr:hypothetical protein [Chloroflexota bacterium]GIK57286.1 MAG: hypothetical protein BroJett015_29490 [Chloroflexota bacterium]